MNWAALGAETVDVLRRSLSLLDIAAA